MAGAGSWWANLQTSLHNAEERILGLGGESSRAADASGYPAVAEDDPIHRLSSFLQPAEPASPSNPAHVELEERLAAFIVRIGSRRTVFEKWFGGDMNMRRLFDVLSLRTRDMGKICLRGSRERCALANEMILPELSLRAAPQYSILFEPEATKEVIYLKRLYSGWCVKIDKATFEALAYGSVDLPEKAFDKLHSLVVRGPVLRTGLLPTSVRVNLMVACDNATHLEREQGYKEKMKASEQRIEENAQRIGVAATAAEPPEVLVMMDTALVETEIVFEAGASFTRTTKDSKVIVTCSEVAVPQCCEIGLEGVSANMALLSDALDRALEAASFNAKIEYWSGLRSSDATSQKLLCHLFDAALDSGAVGKARPAGFEGARELSENYRKNYPKLPRDELAQKLVQWQASLNVGSGFVTGFGGFLTMPITIPTGMIATWVTSARLSFAVAHAYGLDMWLPCVADAVLWCLTGAAEAEGERTPVETLRSRLGAFKRIRASTDTIAEEGCLELEVSTAPQEEQETVPEEEGELMNYDPAAEDFKAKFETLYDLLGVEKTATQSEIRIAYRKLALRYHPDKIRTADPEQIRIATQRFQVLGAAYEELGDADRRKAYDATLSKGTWSWADFAWDTGLKRAQNAWTTAQECASSAIQARPQGSDVTGHLVGRATTQAAVEIIEVTTVTALARAGGQAELRSSIMAGEKLAASASASAGSKFIPILGALVCGAIDGATTASVGRCAVRVFKP